MKIDRSVYAYVGRKASGLYMKHPPPVTPFIPWGPLCVRKHKSLAEATSAKSLTRDRTARSLMSLECVSMCVCVGEIKRNKRKDKINLNDDATENVTENEREEREVWGKQYCYIKISIYVLPLTASYRVTSCWQNGHQFPGISRDMEHKMSCLEWVSKRCKDLT